MPDKAAAKIRRRRRQRIETGFAIIGVCRYFPRNIRRRPEVRLKSISTTQSAGREPDAILNGGRAACLEAAYNESQGSSNLSRGIPGCFIWTEARKRATYVGQSDYR